MIGQIFSLSCSSFLPFFCGSRYLSRVRRPFPIIPISFSRRRTARYRPSSAPPHRSANLADSPPSSASSPSWRSANLAEHSPPSNNLLSLEVFFLAPWRRSVLPIVSSSPPSRSSDRASALHARRLRKSKSLLLDRSGSKPFHPSEFNP